MIKRTSLDDVFSQCIREAADWTCQRCSREFPERKGREFQASHFISRKFNSLRWHPSNVFALCGTCHHEVGSNPAEHTRLARSLLGDGALEMVLERKERICRYRDSDKREMAKHYRSELERLLELRRQGVTGPIELVAYD